MLKVCLLNTNGAFSHLLQYQGIKEAFEQLKSEDFDFKEINVLQQDKEIPIYDPDWTFVASPFAANFRAIKKYMKRKVICYDEEGMYENLGFDSMPYCDIMVTVDKFAVDCYNDFSNKKSLNCKVYHLPLGFSPSIYKFKNVPIEMQSDVCMAGVLFDRRRQILEDLYPLKDQIDLRLITAKDWYARVIHKDAIQKLHKDIVSPEDMVSYYCGAKIILCVNRDYSPANALGKKSTTPGRVFQETACRRLVMIDNDRPEINDYFEDGKEIVIFKDADDLRNKILYYLSNDEEREAIAHNGYIRTMKENTWYFRIKKILEILRSQKN
jgi:spore maturation protein CgeB